MFDDIQVKDEKLAPVNNNLEEEVKDSKVFVFKPTSDFVFDPNDFKVNLENSPFYVGAMTPIASKVRPSDTTNIQSQVS